MPSTNYWVRWDPTNHFWEFSIDQGSSFAALVERPQSTARAISSTPVTIAASDGVVLVDSSAAEATVNLPQASTATNRILLIKKTDSSTKKVIIDAYSTELIDDSLTQTLLVQGETLMMLCDGTAWRVL